MKKTIISIIIILVVFGGIWAFMRMNPPSFKNDILDPATGKVAQEETNVTQVGSQINTTDESSENKVTKLAVNKEKKVMQATMHTSKGDIEIEFGTATPKTIENFIKLAKEGFYDGIKFHRVIKGFMIQAGDPLTKDDSKMAYWGTGGPGYKFNDELTGNEKYPLGTVAMANSGPNTNGSQFFIVTANPSVGLPPSYTVFGKVTKGIETALLIQDVKTAPGDRPIDPIVITGITVK